MKKILIALTLLLSACGVQVKTLPTNRVQLNIQDPTELQMKPIVFSVVGDNICLDETGYKNFVFDFMNIQNFIQLQQQVTDSYRNYYEPSK